MKKILSVFLSIALVLCLLVPTFLVPASAAAVEKNSKIKVWVPDSMVSTAKKIAVNFQEKYKNYNVKVSVAARGEDSAATMLLVDPNSSADVMLVASDRLYNLYNANILNPLSSSEQKSVKKSASASAVNGSKADGKILGYPVSLTGYYLVYNKKVVSAKNAKKFETLLAACKKHNKKFVMDAGNGYYAAMFVFTGGLKLTGINNNYEQKFNKYNEKTVVATLKAYSKLFHKYSSIVQSDSTYVIPSGFIDGTVGAGIDGPWDYNACKNALGKNFAAAKLPTIKVGGKNRQSCGFISVKCFVKNSSTKYPRATAAFARYISSKSAQLSFFKNGSIVPTDKSLQSSAKVKKNIGAKALIAQSKNAQVQANIVDMFWDPMGFLGNKLVSNKINPDTFNFKKLLRSTIQNINS